MSKKKKKRKTGSGNNKKQMVIKQACQLFDAGCSEDAIELLEKASGQAECFDYFYEIARIYQKGNSDKLSMEYLSKAIACDYKGVNPAKVEKTVESIVEAGHGDDNLLSIERAVETFNSSYELKRLHAKVLCSKGLYQDACDIGLDIGNKKPRVAAFIAMELRAASKNDLAEKLCKKILDGHEDALAHTILGQINFSTFDYEKSNWHYQQATRLEPEKRLVTCDRSNVLVCMGQQEESVALLDELLSKDLTKQERQKTTAFRFVNLHYVSKLEQGKVFDCACELRRLYDTPLKKAWSNKADPEKRLRLGFISGDFKLHSVMYFFLPYLFQRDKARVETYIYSNTGSNDDVTEFVRQNSDKFESIVGWSDQRVAKQIEEDEIDIMVDLSGWTSGTRLESLVGKPAPIQVEYLGFPDTTGLEAMDYRISDQWADPIENEPFHVEELAWLPRHFLCYLPPDWAPEVGTMPFRENGYITFGSFNNQKKMNPLLIGLWSMVLKNVENSKMVIKLWQKEDSLLENIYFEEFEKCGISRDRIEIKNYQHRENHLQVCSNIDIALDTFPYNGTTTTCESLWMGVPVISLVGNHHESRVGFSLLKAMNMEVFAASSPDEYVDCAVSLAENPDTLEIMRMGLRDRMRKSAICDVHGFAEDLDELFRHMWYRWCERRGAGPVAEQKLEIIQNLIEETEGDKQKEELGVLHGLTGSGATLISRCIGALEDTVLFGETSPRLKHPECNEAYQALNWFGLFDDQEFENMHIPAWTDFIIACHKRCCERGKKFVLRDWSHIDFFGYPFIRDPQFLSSIIDDLQCEFQLSRIAIVRHPIDQWICLNRDESNGRGLDIDTYLHGCRMFAEMASRTGFIKYEDFRECPEEQMPKICDALGLEYDQAFMNKWSSNENVTGGGDNATIRMEQNRFVDIFEDRRLDDKTRKLFEENSEYNICLKILGYDSDQV